MLLHPNEMILPKESAEKIRAAIPPLPLPLGEIRHYHYDYDRRGRDYFWVAILLAGALLGALLGLLAIELLMSK